MCKSLCKRSCNLCNYYNRCGGCSLCEAAICNKNCKGCGSICPMRGQVIIHTNEVLNDRSILHYNKNFSMGNHIPILPDRLKNIFDSKISKLIGIHGGNFLSSNGKKIRKIYRENGFRRALNLSEDCDGILQFYIKDRTLEGLWDSRNSLYNELYEQKLKYIISPNFSVYEDAPRFEHIYNIKRSLIIYNELSERGFNAIPDVSWYNIQDLDFWIDLLNKSKCNTIAFSFQVVDLRLKASNLWKHYLAGFKYLCSNLDEVKKIILIGVASHKRVWSIRNEIPKNISIHVLNQSAYVQSQRGMYSNGRVRDVVTPKDLLLRKNIEYFNSIYKEMNGGI